MIRMADTAGRHARVAEEVERRVLEVLRSGRYIDGPVVEEARARLASTFGWRYGVGVNCGTDALTYALQAIGVPRGAEVIVPAVTFFASAGAIIRMGGVPVVADIRPALPLLDPARLPIGPKTRAVMAVHLYGEPCRLPGLLVPVVDDSAQTAGAIIKEGIIAGVSFYPTKTLGAAGDGGMVFTDDPEIEQRLIRLTHHGMPSPYLHELTAGHVGANSRLDAVQAAVLLGHLEELPERIARRQAAASLYDLELPAWVTRLPRAPENPVHQYVVQVPERDRLKNYLLEAGIETAIYYPIPLSAQPALQQFPKMPTPHADRFCKQALALPVHEGLQESDFLKIIEAIRSFSPGSSR
jgi:dTDP-4-amino-4,6-dideoxygalactose transaminase